MRVHNAVAVVGIAAGCALGAAAAAGADPIDDAWPYSGLPFGSPTLPGYADSASVTDVVRQQFGPLFSTAADYDILHAVGGADWYAMHDSTFLISSLYSDDHQVVTALLDGAAGYPTAGTVADQSDWFPVYNPAFGTVQLLQNSYVDDPKLGFGDQFAIGLTSITNTFISDAAGIKDVVGAFGQSVTLFEFPAPDVVTP